jgi:FMN phosphatase YigB (HAD superfamily)
MARIYNFKGIDVVALDVFGTILASNDYKSETSARKGTEIFLKRCEKKLVKVCTCSDAETRDLETQLPQAGISLDYFDEFFEMPKGGNKNILWILSHYRINPSKLLVIGDRKEIDALPALNLGCQVLLVPEYKIPYLLDHFDFARVRINS